MTSFKTRKGFYELLIMPFGIYKEPTTFMRLPNGVLQSYLDSVFIVYLDDIPFYITTWEDHISHIMQVLETLMHTPLLS
jgi:hypothetical protein